MGTTPPPPDWDARYAEPGWAFGTEPNDFLRAHAHLLPPAGRVLCVADGEGRNSVWLARAGHRVTAMDLSAVGLAKARALAAAHGVEVATVVADLARFDAGSGCWDGIVSIFAHTPPEVRRQWHARVPRALAPGGVLILEGYTPEQLARGTGGPPDPGKLMTLAGLRAELPGLGEVVARECERPVIEGRYHTGPARVVQLVLRRAG
jgi:SAM-dependent methyltransferase